MNVIVDVPRTRAAQWDFRLFGTPVHVKVFFWIPVALFCPAQDLVPVLIWVAVCLASILAHELGHVAALRAQGISSEIFLYHWGGWTEGRFDPRGFRSRARVALAGPAVGFAIAAAVMIVGYALPGVRASRLAAMSLQYLVAVNLGWSVISLVPVYPFDGWHAARAYLQNRRAYQGQKRELMLSAFTGAAMAIATFALRSPYLALAFLVLALCSAQAAEGSRH